MPAILRLLRPHQWAKNVFVYAPALFSGAILKLDTWLFASAAFLSFCLASSLVYIFNDVLDVKADRQHPIKRLTRPLATGEVSIANAFIVAFILFSGLTVMLSLQPTLIAPIASYLVINAAYNLGLRAVPVLDLIAIGLGFATRVWAGAAVIQVPLSAWILITSFCLATYLAAMKRRNESRLQLQLSRKSLHNYTTRMLTVLSAAAAAASLLAYSFFAVEVRSELAFTIVFVALGLWRFWVLSDGIENAKSPTEALVTDWKMLTISVAWAATCAYLLLS